METKKEQTYKGWLISNNFVKRSLASLGYHFMGLIFIWLILIGIGLIVASIVWIFEKIF